MKTSNFLIKFSLLEVPPSAILNQKYNNLKASNGSESTIFSKAKNRYCTILTLLQNVSIRQAP